MSTATAVSTKMTSLFNKNLDKRPFTFSKDLQTSLWKANHNDAISADFGFTPASLAVGLAVETGVLLAGEAFTYLSKKAYDRLEHKEDSATTLSPLPVATPTPEIAPITPPIPDTVPIAAPSDFHFTADNAPMLGVGIMNSSEVLAQAIGSLCQITLDNHNEHMQVLASMAQNNLDIGTSLAKDLNLISSTLASLGYLLANSGTLNDVAGAVGNIPQTTLQTTNSITEPTDMTAVNAWANSAKTREDFLQTPQTHIDSDGDAMHTLSPMELEAYKNSHHAKHLDDQNTHKIEDDDFNPMSLLTLPLIPFAGRVDMFNESIPTNNLQNPFAILREIF